MISAQSVKISALLLSPVRIPNYIILQIDPLLTRDVVAPIANARESRRERERTERARA